MYIGLGHDKCGDNGAVFRFYDMPVKRRVWLHLMQMVSVIFIDGLLCFGDLRQ